MVFTARLSVVKQSFFGLPGQYGRRVTKANDQNQVADKRFSLKQWFAGAAQSRGLRKPGCGHCYLRFSVRKMERFSITFT